MQTARDPQTKKKNRNAFFFQTTWLISQRECIPNSFFRSVVVLLFALSMCCVILGVDVLGESQLVGYPELPEYNLAPQYPSVALVNWTNGLGNARYWVLKVLIENFEAGDRVVQTAVDGGSQGGSNPFCGDVLNLKPITLQCFGLNATIDKILFASYGTPNGSCGNYTVGKCNAENSTTIMEKACLGKRDCTVNADTPTFGDPCKFVVKNLAVEAHCSSGTGQASNNDTRPLYAQGFTDAEGKNKRILVVNKLHTPQSVNIVGVHGAQVVMVEESRPVGPPITFKMETETLELPRFAVAVVSGLSWSCHFQCLLCDREQF